MDSPKEERLRQKAAAWESFLHTGAIEPDRLDPVIAESWRKCASCGVNPGNGMGRNVLERYQLRELQEQNETIIHTAAPLMHNLYRFFQGSSFVVVLTDAQGYILELFGDDDRLRSAQKLNFLPGAKWQDDDVGTNAIGSVLAAGKPMQVSGAEHFCLRHHCWTCSAAPILDEEGKLTAVLDISGPAGSSYSHTLGMVVAAAEAITMQLKMQRKNKELTLANKRHTISLRSLFHASRRNRQEFGLNGQRQLHCLSSGHTTFLLIPPRRNQPLIAAADWPPVDDDTPHWPGGRRWAAQIPTPGPLPVVNFLR